jgi:hypothetical protein
LAPEHNALKGDFLHGREMGTQGFAWTMDLQNGDQDAQQDQRQKDKTPAG